MKRDDLVIRVAGEAGEGVLSTGQLITQAAARAGFGVLTDSVPPAEIKGGHSFFQIRLASHRLHSRGDELDILLAFNQEAYDKNIKELRPEGLLLYDSSEFSPPQSSTIRQYPLPLTEIAKKQLQFELGKNVVAVGAVAALFGLPMEYITKLLEERFGRKGPEVLDKNLRALEAGRRYVEENVPDRDALQLHPEQVGGDIMVLSGNQAVAMGALVGGCRRYSGYPITPATDIMEFLAAELPKVGGSVVQAEDEIAAIGMVLGASFAGAKAMTATSGPGLSLMTEMLGLAAMAELPAVVVDCQRAGPSTGMPTRHEQADLNLALHGGHGEIQRIVLAPVSVTDCFWLTVNAFNLAEEYQVPVIVLSDTVLAVRTESIPRPDLTGLKISNRQRYAGTNGNGTGIPAAENRFLRYEYTDNGISAVSIPGTAGGQYVATGLEHNEAGRPRYDSVTHAEMTRKRFRKMDLAAQRPLPAHYHGDEQAEIGVITWGSSWGAVVEAIDRLQAEGTRVHAIAPRQLFPLPDEQLRAFMEKKRVILVPEINFTGQFADLLQTHYHREFQRVNVYGGQPFRVSEIIGAIQGVYQRA